MARIYLSPPELSGSELSRLERAIDSNWIAPVGPDVDAFEAEFAQAVQARHAAALSSGTAALHLALRILGVEPGDDVVCADLTFVASANPIVYLGATPIFIDAAAATWTIDPELLAEELDESASRGKLPKAVVAVDLYGQSADYEAILAVCDRYDVPVIEDAAEALGASHRNRPVGGLGRLGVFSFNGNKILTTSGGGMLVSDQAGDIEQTRFLASQAREDAPHYEHTTVGYNYRLSNLLAAFGRAQLEDLDRRVEARRRTFDRYASALASLPGIEFMPEAAYGRSSRWLTCLTIDPASFGADREEVRAACEARDIEARPVWKPMHMQPLYREARVRGGSVGRRLFEHGLCLPSGSGMTDEQIDLVIETVGQCSRASGGA